MTHCRYFPVPGGVAIVCGPRPRRHACADCGKPASLQCDYPLRGTKAGKTCSRHVCSTCAVHVGDETDFCQVHARAERPAQQVELFR